MMLWLTHDPAVVRNVMVVGQVLVALHVLAVWLLAIWVGRKIRILGEYMVKRFYNAEAQSLFDKFKQIGEG